MSPQMLEAALSTYSKVAGLVGCLAIAIFTARLSMLAATVAGPSDYADSFKSIVAFFISLALAPFVFKAIILSSGHLAEQIGTIEAARHAETTGQAGVFNKLMGMIAHDSPFFWFVTSAIPLSISYIASSIYSLLLGTLCAATPIVLLYFELSNSSQSLKSVASATLVLSSWPIMWNLMGLLANQMWPSFSHTTVATFVFWSLVKILQLLSPLFSVMFFKSFSIKDASKGKTIIQSTTRFVTGDEKQK